MAFNVPDVNYLTLVIGQALVALSAASVIFSVAIFIFGETMHL